MGIGGGDLALRQGSLWMPRESRAQGFKRGRWAAGKVPGGDERFDGIPTEHAGLLSVTPVRPLSPHAASLEELTQHSASVVCSSLYSTSLHQDLPVSTTSPAAIQREQSSVTHTAAAVTMAMAVDCNRTSFLIIDILMFFGCLFSPVPEIPNNQAADYRKCIEKHSCTTYETR